MTNKKPTGSSGKGHSTPRYDQRKPPTNGGKKPAKKPAPKSKAKQAPESQEAASGGWGTMLLNWGGTVILWGILFVGAVMGYFAYTLPDISGINDIQKRPSMVLEASNGTRFATYGDLYGKMLKPGEIPQVMKNAILATEDAHFYDHFGINPFSLVRAAWRNYEAGRVVEGGSTITQQLAKNLFLTPERSIARKIREVLLAFWLEANYSKEEILALYLNRVYFGSGTYGIDAATRKYFSKPVAKLSTAEAAMLAGLVKAPTYYAPTVSLNRAQQRSTVVMRRMQAVGHLTKTEADKLVKQPATLRHAGSNFRNVRYYSDWVVSEVRSFIGRSDLDLVIRTTLDLNLQKAAETSIERTLAKQGKKFDVEQAAMVAMGPKGDVLAMVGGRKYASSSFNRATSAKRQPGSVFKTVVFAAGFENGRNPNDIYQDKPVNIGGWKPNNYTRRYQGPMSLRSAYAQSINTVAVRLAEDIGRGRVADMAKTLGLTGSFPTHPSISLGTNEVTLIEMTSAYAIIANGGSGVLPYGVLEIRTKGGEVLYKRQSSGKGRMISGRTVNNMRDIMSHTLTNGTGRAANPGFAAAGKTGTTQDYRDAWFIGFTPDLVAGVWFGNDNGSPTKKVTGSNLPAVTWKSFMQEAKGKKPAPQFVAVAEKPLEDQTSIWQRILNTFSDSADGRPTGGNTPASKVERAYPREDDARP
ncbi:PBP1A family penicillin-binding protein [Sneathiella sp. P13V-1]|uniref:transglycosylase domain-containing protein n=1 Tax=Sneathiella sp. P13V-1 TaxID=2697366 RepID=UPI00187B4FCC|nr:PBP1A family penicillin-binding protein [Sneathiella sp. P13V-1]MBE7636040.1 PBP1A family penicillin-binding protein [Sneathiella sp. P13V-1]